MGRDSRIDGKMFYVDLQQDWPDKRFYLPLLVCLCLLSFDLPTRVSKIPMYQPCDDEAHQKDMGQLVAELGALRANDAPGSVAWGGKCYAYMIVCLYIHLCFLTCIYVCVMDV